MISDDIFKFLSRKNQDEYFVELSFFENCGDRNFDLLNNRKELSLLEDEKGNINVAGLSFKQVNDINEMQNLLNIGNKLRSTHPTLNNPSSSRSHAICSLTIKVKSNIIGRIRVVDLAGSERKEDMYEHTDERINEMKDINWYFLVHLKNVQE